jgi:CRISPR system Cascade subunit CasC
MKIELHIIQNFAPSCLNRDDTNTPKDCVFGGVRRARISSQCIKRAIRTAFLQDKLIPQENLAHRTNRLAEEVARRLAAGGKDEGLARAAAEAAIGGLGFGTDDKGRTQYLLFLGESGIKALVNLCEQHWDKLAELAAKAKDADVQADSAKAKKSTKEAKKDAKEAVPDEIKKALRAVLDGSKASDLALFGRMLADMPGENIDAACQVAHAISTNKIEMEMDFFTAVDDLKADDEDAGAGMMGVIGYNSACFYRYAVVDWPELAKNLGGDTELAHKSLEAFLLASASAMPSGKQNTFAAHQPPDLIVASVRHKGAPLSLANAFVQPVRPTHDKNLTQASVDAMKAYYDKVAAVYGDKWDTDGPFCCGMTLPPSDGGGWENVGSLSALVQHVMDAVKKGRAS